MNKRSLIKSIVVLAIVAVMVASCTIGAFAESDYMAYNIYLDPVLAGTSGQFDAYTIEFRGIKTPHLTYWALCNFALAISPETSAEYSGIGQMGAYAGLQNADERKLIMAFWESFYNGINPQTGKQNSLRATRMYPVGKESNFGGEGEGTNHIRHFEWDDNTWYRMYLCCWEDSETGFTFVGQWFENMETGEWTIGSIFNSKLKKSYITGALSLFQENFVNDYEQERSFNVKNLYALDHKTGKWASLNKATLSYGDGGAANKAGAHTFGATDEYFWGEAGGVVENQKLYNAQSISSKVFTITQPAKPTFDGSISIKKTYETTVNTMTKEKALIWVLDKPSTPQMSYELKAFDNEGNEIYKESSNRPYVTSCSFNSIGTDTFKYELTLTDLFGNTTTTKGVSKEYKKLYGDPYADTTPTTTQPAETTDSSTSGLPTGAIIGIAAGAVVVVGVVVAVVIISKKKKKN